VTTFQGDRDQYDAWMIPISRFLENMQAVTLEEIFTHGLEFEYKNQWKRSDEVRIGNVMKKLKWKRH
jgi:hypothetical protein